MGIFGLKTHPGTQLCANIWAITSMADMSAVLLHSIGHHILLTSSPPHHLTYEGYCVPATSENMRYIVCGILGAVTRVKTILMN